MSPRQTKKKKVDLDDLCKQAFEHYRNYLDSLDEQEQGDIDELQEIIEIASPHIQKYDKCNSVVDLLPVLVSVAYNILAEGAISEYLAAQASDGEVSNDVEPIQELLSKSLEWYPENANTWSMGANFGRISHRLSLRHTREWYERAVECSTKLRTEALAIVDDESIDDMLLKEWMELLILNQVLGIEFEGPEEEDDKEESANIEEPSIDDNTGEDGQYSVSAVESTSRFMCAMLWSMVDHDAALAHLRKFNLTHRLHPNVWSKRDKLQTESATQAPLVFRPKDGLLPEGLYQSMKKTFAPNAAYWKESSYSNRGYFSYFMDYKKEKKPQTLIEEVIVNHLLPRAFQALDETDANSICGFEWWVHTRPIQANLGHNLHFDTDEAMLAQEGKVTHPILSSVLYLSGGDDENSAGPTILLDQTPDSKEVAESAWISTPTDNSFMLFPGNLLHGVLPCPGDQRAEQRSSNGRALVNSWQDPTKDRRAHRLTFMVGFWTRSVPAMMKERRLYGPCGPLPPATDEHTWVRDIFNGYDSANGADMVVAEKEMPGLALPQVSPAWERIEKLGVVENQPPLQIPHAIDHRFFVRDAPQCFRESLFEDQEDCE
eukprot:scaffold23803_cov132-Cylindrotheca_fusiformis.AAC.5